MSNYKWKDKNNEYYHKEIAQRLIYIFYPKFMDILGLDCYGLISISDIKTHPYKKEILNSDKLLWNWKCLSTATLYGELEHFMHHDIVYHTDRVITAYLESYGKDYSIWSVSFFIVFITGLAHELRHVWQYINCCGMTDEEAEVDAVEFETVIFDKLLNDKYLHELIENLIRTFTHISKIGSDYVWMAHANPPIIRKVKVNE